MVEAHLLVLCHGMWGNIGHFDYIVQQLRLRGAVSHDRGPFPARSLPAPPKGHELPIVVYRTHSNEGYFTYDGIDVCGTRVANEVCAEVEALAAAGVKVTKLSLMGYSMGGIMMRYAAGVLYTRGVFDRIIPGTFTSIVSPHVGVNVLGDRTSTRVFNFIGSWSMARTSRQVFLKDRYEKSGTPLFLHITDPDSPYARALALFERRALYANIVSDRRCEYYTAAAVSEDPFAGGRSKLLEGPYASNYGPIVLEGTDKARFRSARSLHDADKDADTKPAGAAAVPLRWLGRVARLVWTALKVSIVIPAWFVAFLINAGYQAVASSIRTAGILRSGSHVPNYEYSAMDGLLENEADGMVEEMYSSVYFNTPVLRLSSTMKRIVEQFDAMDWEKYPVHITADANAHSAVIVRSPEKQSFWEGRYVIKHWLEQVLRFEPDWTPRPHA